MSKLATVLTATIAASGTISAAVALGNKRLAAIQMPSGWDAAVITFQGSLDGVTFVSLFDAYGVEISIPAASATLSQGICADVALLAGWPYLKVRSGTLGSAVTQSAARALLLGVIELIGE